MTGGTRNGGLFAQVSRVPVIVPLAERVPGQAEHADLTGWLILAAIPVALLAWYAASCWWFPFRDCRVCDGTGSHRSDRDRRNSRKCWWCKGAAKRLRWGRRLWNAIQRRRKAASRG